MIKVGVVFGGVSVEHEVSIISAVQAMNKMDSEKYEIIPIYISKENEWYTGSPLREIETFKDIELLKRYTKNIVLYRLKDKFVLQTKGFFKKIINDVDIIFPIVHGTNVEDGNLQGYLKTIGVPFVGSDVLSSAIAQDKIIQKKIFDSVNLNTPDYLWFYDNDYKLDKEKVLKSIESTFKFPLVIKPATLGSSVGISVAKDKKGLEKAIDTAIEYDNKVIVETKIENLAEVNISVLGNYENQKLSEIEEVLTSNSVLTYDDKYINGSKKLANQGMASAKRKIPATIEKKILEDVREMAVKAFKEIGLSGTVRIDFLVDTKAKKAYINEINACPGSLAFYLWEPKDKSFTILLDEMINIGVKDFKRRNQKINSFNTNILSNYQGMKGSKGKLKL